MCEAKNILEVEPEVKNYFVVAELAIKCKNEVTINARINGIINHKGDSLPNFDYIGNELYKSYLGKCCADFEDTVINYETFVTTLNLI